MSNLDKKVVLSDGIYEIDYESLANKPDVHGITVSSSQPTSTDGNDGDLWFVYAPPLAEASWADISEISASGVAKNAWSIGDTKAVELNGTVGTLAVNTTLYAYILGFDHNVANGESKGITFGTFKTAATDGIDVCLVDSSYGSNLSDGTKAFNINHWGNS